MTKCICGTFMRLAVVWVATVATLILIAQIISVNCNPISRQGLPPWMNVNSRSHPFPDKDAKLSPLAPHFQQSDENNFSFQNGGKQQGQSRDLNLLRLLTGNLMARRPLRAPSAGIGGGMNICSINFNDPSCDSRDAVEMMANIKQWMNGPGKKRR